jgi:hypothetical protein
MAAARHDVVGSRQSFRRAGRSVMKRSRTTFAAATFVMIGMAMMMIGLPASPLRAAPPTVTPSPGYDARLQEQRSGSTFSAPEAPIVRPVHRRLHIKHGHNS